MSIASASSTLATGHYLSVAHTAETSIWPLVLRGFRDASGMSLDEFFEFCQRNPDLRMELTAEGDLHVMTPTGLDTGRRNSDLILQLGLWNKQTGLGVVFDSSAAYSLPNGAVLSPDASWIKRERWDALTPEQRKRFASLAPDFAVELKSPTDRLSTLREKLQTYISNGVRMGWLINPETRRVEIYRPNLKPVELDNPATVAADPELPGFVLELNSIW